MLIDVSQWKGTHYCRGCGYGIDPKDDDRACVVTDGDLCQPVRRTPAKKPAGEKKR